MCSSRADNAYHPTLQSDDPRRVPWLAQPTGEILPILHPTPYMPPTLFFSGVCGEEPCLVSTPRRQLRTNSTTYHSHPRRALPRRTDPYRGSACVRVPDRETSLPCSGKTCLEYFCRGLLPSIRQARLVLKGTPTFDPVMDCVSVLVRVSQLFSACTLIWLASSPRVLDTECIRAVHKKGSSR